MEMQLHTVQHLFAQLGLGSDEKAIDAFILSHSPLPPAIRLYEAPFWTPAQARFLKEEIASDADWAEVVDQLDTRLR